MLERRRRLKTFVTNLPLAILSLLIAGGLWFYVVSGQVIEVNLDLPIKPVVPDGLIVVSYTPKVVTLYIKAKKRQIMILQKSHIEVKVDRGIKPGKKKIPLNENHVKFPIIAGNLEFRVMGRAEMTLDVDSLVQKKVKVVLSNGLRASPDSVLVIGPARYLKNLTSVLTDSVPVKGNYTTISLGGKLIKVIPSVVKVVP